MKSTLYTGNPATGSVEFKRFVNSTARNYGTARAAAKGDAVTAPPIVVNLDQKKEIVEEVAQFDLDTFGVTNVMKRRAANHIDTMATDLDIAFFATAGAAASAVTTSETTEAGKLEAAIQALETVKNEYVQGVPRNMIVAVVTPAFYGKIRLHLDSLPASNVDTAAEEFGMFHGVRVYSGLNLPDGIDALVMAVGSVALPVVAYPYGDPEKIPLSNDYAVSLFYNYGKKALTPDLIVKLETVPSTLGELDVTSAAGTEKVGDTVITVNPATPGEGNKYVYKLGTSYVSFKYDDTLTTGWTDLTEDAIAAGTATKVTVAEVVSATGKARARGIAVLVKKTE